jgi:hypothetical protein
VHTNARIRVRRTTNDGGRVVALGGCVDARATAAQQTTRSTARTQRRLRAAHRRLHLRQTEVVGARDRAAAAVAQRTACRAALWHACCGRTRGRAFVDLAVVASQRARARRATSRTVVTPGLAARRFAEPARTVRIRVRILQARVGVGCSAQLDCLHAQRRRAAVGAPGTAASCSSKRR